MINQVLDYIEMTVVHWMLFHVLSYVYLYYWHSWVNSDYGRNFFTFILIN